MTFGRLPSERLQSSRRTSALCALVLMALVACLSSGCGQTRQQLATEQMLASDAVDRSVAQLNLEALSGKKVYFDTQYIRAVKGAGFVNADYIISSLRQQMFAFGCRLQDNREDAEVIIEGRVGVLGIDDHEITYGMPASNTLNTAASVTGTQIPLPALPELSIAKKNEQIGASKIALFAYDRESREPIWQSGVATSMSDSDAFWVFGAGPFRRGTIYRGMHLAGTRVRIPQLLRDAEEGKQSGTALTSYQEELDYTDNQEPAPIVEAADAKQLDGAAKPSDLSTPATLSVGDEPSPAAKPQAAPKPAETPEAEPAKDAPEPEEPNTAKPAPKTSAPKTSAPKTSAPKKSPPAAKP